MARGELAMPEDGPIDWMTHADLAEATAVALTDEGLTDTILNLTGASPRTRRRSASQSSSRMPGRRSGRRPFCRRSSAPVGSRLA